MSPTPRRPSVVLQLGADIVDLKDARRGALGAVSLETARQAIAAVAGRSETSATLGDPPYDEEELLESARALAAMGVDYVKLAVDAAYARSPRRVFEQAWRARSPSSA